MMKRLLLASALLLPMAANAGMMRGAGATTCGSWLADRADFGVKNLMLNWALGYLSATADLAATADMFDPLATADANAVMYWLDNFCSAHPVLSFPNALKSFALEQLTGQPNDWQAAR
jgi:hypothetical protein